MFLFHVNWYWYFLLSKKFPNLLTKVITVIEQGHKTVQEDHMKLEETCVMVTGDDLELVPKEVGNLKVNKVHTESYPLPLKFLSLFGMHSH